MKICFLTTEIFTHGYFGGYGKIMRNIGSGLAKRGHEISVLMPRVPGQKELEIVDGIKVYSYPVINKIPTSFSLPFAIPYFKKINPDIFHSCEINVITYLAMKIMPNKIHVIDFQDPRTKEEEKEILTRTGMPSIRKRRIFALGILEKIYQACVKRSDEFFVPGKYLIEKVRKKYNLKENIKFLPNPVDIPEGKIKKTDKPTVAYVGRFDWVKRPEIYFELSKKFPGVDFLVLGKSYEEYRTNELRRKYGNIKNLKFLGFISDDKEKGRILEKVWILVNTSIHECVPQSFLEALSYKCAILSCHNPDNLVSNHGFYTGKVSSYSTEKFEEGLRYLLEKNRWKKLGEKGQQHMKDVYATEKTIKMHERVHLDVLNKCRR